MCEFVMRQTAHKSQRKDNDKTNTMKILQLSIEVSAISGFFTNEQNTKHNNE